MNSNRPSVLVTGATGLLGRAVLREFLLAGYDATGLSHRRRAARCLPADLADTASVASLLDGIGADVVIHCAAERHPDVSQRDPEGTRRLNVDATREIASWCLRRGAFLVVISTDYVFDGTKPPYRVEDEPNPLNAYGASKLAAERAALEASDGAAAVLRVPILYGDTDDLSESAVTVLAANLLKASPGETLSFEARCIRYPTHTADIAQVLRRMVEARRGGMALDGIFHWSGGEAMTKLDMARAMAPLLGIEGVTIAPDTRPPTGAPRPVDAHLDLSRLEGLGLSIAGRPFASAVASILGPFVRSCR